MPSITDRILVIRNLEVIRHIIDEAQTIAISGHCNPDGDSMGALLSLGLGLESLGKQVYMVCSDNVPRNYRSLPGVSRLLKTIHRNVDVAIAVDCGSKEMIGPNYEIFERAGAIIEIDHHRSRTPFGDISLVDPEATSAGELVYELLTELDITITKDIAQNILTSIIVETNSFRLPGVRSETFEQCADLVGTGVDFTKLAETVYWVTSKETALLSGTCMSRCKFSEDGEIAWATLTRKDFEKIGATDADADPVTETIRSIQGVKIAILFREKNRREWRVSLRSKEGIDISLLAEQFGGGGHISAAGCTVPKRHSIMKKIIASAAQLLDKHRALILSRNLLNQENSSIENDFIDTGIPSVIFYENITSNKKSIDWQEESDALPIYSKPLGQKIAS